jgi:chromosomal replication initiation ATPase DnaA
MPSHQATSPAPTSPLDIARDIAAVAGQGGPQAEHLRLLIETAVTRVFGVPHDDIEQPTRGRKKVALARQAGMYLAHVVCGLSLKDAGRLFHRDRTTAAHACSVIEDRRDDPVFDRVMQLLEWIIPALIAPQRPRQPH